MRTSAGLVTVLLGLALGAPTTCEARADATFRPGMYFAGRTHSEGVIRDAFGKVTGRLSGSTHGRRQSDGSTVFDQTIRFDDKTSLDRRWRVVRTGPHTIEATATDLVGAAEGRIDGRTLHLASTVRLDDGNPLTDVDFDQTMVLAPDGRTMLNHSVVSKFGIVVRYIDERFVRSSARERRN